MAQADSVSLGGDPSTSARPKSVPYDALNDAKIATGKNVEREAISIALTVLYEAPKFVCPPGTADHFPLDKDEEKSLIGRIEDVIAMLPKRKRTQAMKFIGKIMPPIALGVTAYMITAPRVQLTRLLIEQYKQRMANVQANGGSQADSGSAANGHAANATASGIGFDTASHAGNGRARSGPLDSHFASDEAFRR